MTGSRISSGSSFEELAGYARAVVLPDPGGDWVLVSGTTGYDYDAGTLPEDVVDQCRQCFRNIAAALEQAGSSLDDLVRIRVYTTSRRNFERIAPVVAEHTAAARPANTTVLCDLVELAMKVEIEVTARKAATGA